MEGSAKALSPNGDGAGEQLAIAYSISEPAKVTTRVTNPDGAVVRTLTASSSGGPGSVTWDGRTAAGTPVPDGRYTVAIAGRDAAGNVGDPAVLEVDVYAALTAISRTPTLFYPPGRGPPRAEVLGELQAHLARDRLGDRRRCPGHRRSGPG